MNTNISQHSRILLELFSFVILISSVNFILLQFDHLHLNLLFCGIIIVLAMVKVIFLYFYTLNRINRDLNHCKTYHEVVVVMGFIVLIIILSFTLDYYCLSTSFPHAFQNLPLKESAITRFLDLFYFSIVTFTSTGFGDITPVHKYAKILVASEIATNYVFLIFLLSNVKNWNKNQVNLPSSNILNHTSSTDN